MADDSESTESTVPSRSAVSGYGVTLTLVGAVLLALAYYGVQAVDSAGELGETFPVPVYVFVFALLFAVELLNSQLLGLYAVGRAAVVTLVYGTLFVVAVEGVVYLWDNPDVVLDEYAGLTVLAGALVAAVLLYVGYLTVVDRGG
ncbi:MAG: hypothetical protein ACOC0Z_05410 [Halohasta sp.]